MAEENKVRKARTEAVYSKKEIMAAAAGLGISPDALAGALRQVDKDSLTRAEVEKAIQNFKRKQV